jgi:hypothetical protein
MAGETIALAALALLCLVVVAWALRYKPRPIKPPIHYVERPEPRSWSYGEPLPPWPSWPVERDKTGRVPQARRYERRR